MLSEWFFIPYTKYERKMMNCSRESTGKANSEKHISKNNYTISRKWGEYSVKLVKQQLTYQDHD